VTKEFLISKYKDHYLGYLAFDMHQPIAFAGFSLFKIQYNAQIETGAQDQDGMSTEEVRGKGVYTKLCRMAEEIAIQEGATFAFGFANQNSAPVLIHQLGYHCSAMMSVFEIPVGGFPTMKWYNKLGWKMAYQNRLERKLQPYLIKEPFENPWPAGLVYDFNFFAYKSYQQHYFILVEGVKVWLKPSHVLTIGNIENCGEDKLLQVVEKLTLIAGDLGFGQLLLQFSPQAMQAKTLSKKYRTINGTSICLKNFSSNLPLDQLIFAQGDIDTF
jgi:GNAT superfamily N-acetyltransferase